MVSDVFAVDVGGTFTDIVVLDSETGDVRIGKVPTTPSDPSEGVPVRSNGWVLI